MKTTPFFAMLASILILSLIAGCATLTGQEAASDRKIEPIVSTKWLAASMHLKNLVIIDIRSPDAFGAGHIPGSINEPFVAAVMIKVRVRDNHTFDRPVTAMFFVQFPGLLEGQRGIFNIPEYYAIFRFNNGQV